MFHLWDRVELAVDIEHFASAGDIVIIRKVLWKGYYYVVPEDSLESPVKVHEKDLKCIST